MPCSLALVLFSSAVPAADERDIELSGISVPSARLLAQRIAGSAGGIVKQHCGRAIGRSASRVKHSPWRASNLNPGAGSPTWHRGREPRAAAVWLGAGPPRRCWPLPSASTGAAPAHSDRADERGRSDAATAAMSAIMTIVAIISQVLTSPSIPQAVTCISVRKRPAIRAKEAR